MNIYRQYASLYQKREELDKKMEELRDQIIQDMLSHENTEIDVDEGTYRLRQLKKWQYSNHVDSLATELSLAKRIEEQTGTATLVSEKWSLAFIQ